MPNNLEGTPPLLGELISDHVSDLLFRGLRPALRRKKKKKSMSTGHCFYRIGPTHSRKRDWPTNLILS